MQEIIKISTNTIGDSSVNSVSARDLHRELGVKTRFNDWFKRQVLKYEFIKNKDYIAVTQKKVTVQGNKSEYTDYILKVNMAKELAMVENNEVGRKIRRYFIEIEESYKLQISESKTERNENLISVSTEDMRKELEALKFVFDNFNLSEKEKIAYTNKFFERTNIPILDNPQLKKHEPVFTLTDLLKEFQISMQTSKFNIKLSDCGIIEYSENGWVILEMKFGENRKFRDGINPKYYKSTFQELLDIVFENKGEV